MNRLFNLDSYKNYLVNFYTNKCDEEKYQERLFYVESHYSDKFLNKTVINTEKFVLSILKEMYLKIESSEDKVWMKTEISSYIFQDVSNGCRGGWHADTLFCPNEQEFDYLVSEYLVRNFFGEKFRIDVYDNLTEVYDEEEEVGHINCTTYLTLVGPRGTFIEILDTYFPDRKCLVKK